MPPALAIAPEVAAALAAGRPVVALESTVIAHGLPRPGNLAVAGELEDAVRAGGAVPATIAVLDGVARVGLDEGQRRRVAEDSLMRKLGARDLARAGAGGARRHHRVRHGHAGGAGGHPRVRDGWTRWRAPGLG
jgi:pseudouridine-5'-phosphate glycosidase